MTTLDEWDRHWIKVYDRAVDRGETPNEAIVVADSNTEESLGSRPVDEIA